MRPADPDPADPIDEQGLVEMRRYREARQAGLEHKEAMIFACNGVDVGLLRKLVADDCPVKLRGLIVI